MKRFLIAAVAVATLMPASLALARGKDCGCKHDKMEMNDEHADAKLKTATVAEVVKLQSDKSVSIYDADTQEWRTKEGVIPGAKLLSDAMNYDPAKELPAAKDAKLIFYCAGGKCMASHHAAERAVGAGYTDVTVMPDGISGWKAAGNKVEAVSNKI